MTSQTIVLGGRRIDVHAVGRHRILVDRRGRRYLRLPEDTPLGVGVLALPWRRFERADHDRRSGGLVLRLGPSSSLRIGPDAA